MLLECEIWWGDTSHWLILDKRSLTWSQRPPIKKHVTAVSCFRFCTIPRNVGHQAGAGFGGTTASLLLALPLLLHWISLVWLYARLNIKSFWSLPFKQKMLHLLANTWTVQPVRESKAKNQIHKSREIAGSLLLTGINLTITHTVTAFLIEDATPIPDVTLDFLGVSREIFSKKRNIFLIMHVLPATLSFAMGCGLLLLFYKTVHPWRHLGKERERHFFGKLGGSTTGIVVETSFCSQV